MKKRAEMSAEITITEVLSVMKKGKNPRVKKRTVKNVKVSSTTEKEKNPRVKKKAVKSAKVSSTTEKEKNLEVKKRVAKSARIMRTKAVSATTTIMKSNTLKVAPPHARTGSTTSVKKTTK